MCRREGDECASSSLRKRGDECATGGDEGAIGEVPNVPPISSEAEVVTNVPRVMAQAFSRKFSDTG